MQIKAMSCLSRGRYKDMRIEYDGAEQFEHL